MKRFFIYAVLVLIPASIQAEDLQFVTTLSSPVGTFSQLETADPTIAAVSPVVNFCNTRTSTGRIELRGANAYLQNLTLKNGTTLGGDVSEYRISSLLNVNAGGRITGERLMANNVDFTGSSDAKSKVDNTLYTADVAVKGYKTDSLEISGKIKTSGMGNGEQMIWSNAYARDYNCSSGSCAEKGSSYSSYLLKSDTDNPGGCSEASYKSSHKSECCVDAPTSDSVCYMDCNCRMEAHSNGSPSKVREEYSLCQFINGNCAWGYERTYTKESGCASQMLSQYPNGGSGTCQWVTNIYITADAPYCQHMYNSCIMSGGGTTRPYYYIYNQSYIVEEVCVRCKNGW